MPVTVIGGYLGAGKTTLVNHLLRQAGGRRIAVLVNDFGELPIDEDLIESRDGNVIGIAGGCICCSYGSDLIDAMLELAKRTPRPDHVLLETSGVALPGPVAASVTLVAGFTIDGIVVVADAETVTRTGRDRYLGDTIIHQIRDADLIVLNKTDLAGEPACAAAETWIEKEAPRARIVRAERAALPIEVALGTAGTEPAAGGGCRLEPNAATHVAWASARLDLTRPMDLAALAAALTDRSLGIVRAKGIATGLDGAPSVIHVVGARSTVEPLPGVTAGRALEPGHGRLVCIGLARSFDRAGIAAAIAAL